MDRYLLLSDEDEKLLNLHKTGLKYFYGGEIFITTSNEKTLEILNKHGKPELLFIDYHLLTKDQGKLFHHLAQLEMDAPIIAASPEVSNHPLLGEFPVAKLLAKPVEVEALARLVKNIMASPMTVPSHVPLNLQTLLELASGSFDYYLRLSGRNYVKIIHKGDPFTMDDLNKLLAKGIKEVHLKASDSFDFIKSCEEKLNLRLAPHTHLDPVMSVNVAIDALEQIEGISKALGWTPDILNSAQAAVKTAIHVLEKDVKLSQVLRDKFSNPSSLYSMHVGLQTYLSTGFCVFLNWAGDFGQVKLAMAALLHDLAVDNDYYQDIESWNTQASDLKIKTPEVTQYRLHPFQASKIAQQLDQLPPDVDQIILQHHEVKDGSGFPRGLTASRISPLASLFIMVEDLVEFINKGHQIETSLKDYLTWGEAYYDQGHFLKIFQILRSKIPERL